MIATRLKTLRGNARQAYDLALAGAIGAVFGLFFYVELIVTPSVWVRDALAGMLIGGAIGYALNAAGPLRDRAWLTLARASSWGAIAGALGGAIGLVVGEVVLGSFKGGLIGRAVSWSVLGLGIGLGQGIAYRSWEKLAFGLVGGGIGGFVGGWLFESLRKALGDQPSLGQGVGIACLGAGLGLGLALVEQGAAGGGMGPGAQRAARGTKLPARPREVGPRSRRARGGWAVRRPHCGSGPCRDRVGLRWVLTSKPRPTGPDEAQWANRRWLRASDRRRHDRAWQHPARLPESRLKQWVNRPGRSR